jgi:hypothetical protein
MYGYCWWVTGPSDELSHIGIADSTYSAVGFGGNYLTVLPDIGAVVTVATDTVAAPMTNDDYQELVAHVVEVLS